jgi:hypothetical protein
MVFTRSLITASAFLLSASVAQAGSQLFEASWSVKAFGNELTGGTGASAVYSAWAIPQGIQCNDQWPRCPFQSTPTDGAGNFGVQGGTFVPATYCAPWANWQGLGTTMRPAKGQTALDAKGRPIPPLYRNPGFFTASTPSAQPNRTYCNGTSTDGAGGPGKVMLGNPVAGTWSASTTGSGGFNIAPAPTHHRAGIRTTGQIGDFQNIYPYIYSYTYATFRNDAGAFGPGKGPGNFTLTYTMGTVNLATIRVKQGKAKFGGTMRMLGALTTNACYFRQGDCVIARAPNGRYEAIGAAAYTSGGVVTQGYLATYSYCVGGNWTDCWFGPGTLLHAVGARFPWTTGSVTLRATGRGPHKTVHYAKGYDNRTPTSGRGTIQLVSPTFTRWLQPAVNFETGGIGIFRIKFVPEPRAWAMLIAGVSCLGVLHRWRS